MIKLAVIEDNDVWKYIIQDRIEKKGNFKIIANCSLGEEFFHRFENADEIDLVILDLDLPAENGFEIADQLKSKYPCLPFVVFTSYSKHSVQAAYYSLGAKAVISKSLINNLESEVLNALGKGTEDAYDYKQLNRDELKLLLSICEGKTNKEIADLLFKEEATIEYRCRMLASKLKIKNRKNNFVAFAIKYGFWFPGIANN